MNIVSVLHEYSEIALAKDLKGPTLRFLYESAEGYLRSRDYIKKGYVIRKFLFELFPRRGLVIPFHLFVEWMGRNTSKIEVITEGSFLSRSLKGPGYKSFKEWLAGHLEVYHQDICYDLGLVQSYIDWNNNLQVFPKNEGYIIPYLTSHSTYDFEKKEYSRSNYGLGNKSPLWNILPISIQREAGSVSFRWLKKEEDLCIYVDKYAIIFTFREDLALVYGIMDLTTSKWVFNEKYEQIKTLYKV